MDIFRRRKAERPVEGEVEIKDMDAEDAAVMAQIGKRQKLMRIFDFAPSLCTALCILASWEALAISFAAGLENGGPAGLVYGMILTVVGLLAMACSLAEMASMCPISGAQFHWSYMFAPQEWAPFATWMQGWMTVFAWITSCASAVYINSTFIQGLVILNSSAYESSSELAHRWQGTLLMWAFVALAFVVNAWGFRILPVVELIAGMCHFAFFVILLIVLVVLAQHKSASFVFTERLNEGWSSYGVSFCVGLLTPTFSLTGFDGIIHISEEIRGSARAVPRIVVLSVAINGVLAFAFLIAGLFCLGDLDEDLDTPTGYPFIAIFYQATGSLAWTTVLCLAPILIGVASAIANAASVSRLTYAFAWDGGSPFSNYFAHVDPHYHVPIRALSLVCAIICLLSLINIGSTVALEAIWSLTTLAFVVSYVIPMSLLVSKRLRKEPIPYGPFTLGKYGMAINLFGLAYGLFIIVWLPFPETPDPNASTLNYAGPVLGLLILIALADWIFRGRFFFTGSRREIDGQAALAAAARATETTASPAGEKQNGEAT